LQENKLLQKNFFTGENITAFKLEVNIIAENESFVPWIAKIMS